MAYFINIPARRSHLNHVGRALLKLLPCALHMYLLYIYPTDLGLGLAGFDGQMLLGSIRARMKSAGGGGSRMATYRMRRSTSEHKVAVLNPAPIAF